MRASASARSHRREAPAGSPTGPPGPGRYRPRPSGQNGRIKDWQFYVSTTAGSWGTAAATGTFANSSTEKQITFAAVTGRYVRLRALSEVNGNPWTSMAELNVLGTLAAPTTTTTSTTTITPPSG